MLANGKALPHDSAHGKYLPITEKENIMSTRATYEFTFGTVFMQNDNYPSNAAEYLKSAKNVEQFIRANLEAELTIEHSMHQDTDYQYDINDYNGHLVARKSYPDEVLGQRYDVFFEGTVNEFITKYGVK
jgi:hypothetical protein|tara:strand:- start:103 stop:492 length:390 start_codon:yes stop_codon:yes gene_type:complete